MIFLRTLCLMACLTVLLPAGSRAATLSAEEMADIAAVEAWLDSIKTYKAEFLQSASTGGVASGTFFLSRPGRMLIDYAPPAQLDVYSDGTWLIYVDHELKEVNQVPLAATPARILVHKNVRLTKEADIEVIRSERAIRLKLTKKNSPEDGSIMLVFSRDPIALRAWTIIDPQGIETTITLIKPELNQAIDEKRVIYSPPDWTFQ